MFNNAIFKWFLTIFSLGAPDTFIIIEWAILDT